MTRAVNLANFADDSILKVDGANDRVGIGSTQPTGKLDISGDTNINGGSLFITNGGLQVSGITTILGSLNATSTLDSTGIQTGALATLGGLAVVKSAHIGGNLSVGGTITYEDVTNVDSVGIVTARTGIKVLAGGINAVGVVTATSFSGDGSALTGVESWNQFDTWLYGGG